MQLAHKPGEPPASLSQFERVPLAIVFADGELLAEVRGQPAGRNLVLEPPFHVSDGDVYLVVPSDIGGEIVDIFADGDVELVRETMRDSLLACGLVERRGRGHVTLQIERGISAERALSAGLAYGARVRLDALGDPLKILNGLPHVRVTLVSQLLDDEGLEAALRHPEHVGVGWRVPPTAAPELRSILPTHIWTRHLADGIGIEAALYAEDDDLVVLLRPALLIP